MSTTSYLYGGLSASTISANTISTANLKINSPGTGTSITTLGLDVSGNLVSGATGGGSSYFTSGSSGSYSIKADNDSGLDATGSYAVAEGGGSLASGSYSHAEGFYTTASGYSSHAEGYESKAMGAYSHAGGYKTYALSFDKITPHYIGGIGYSASTQSVFVNGDYSSLTTGSLLLYSNAQGTYVESVFGSVTYNASENYSSFVLDADYNSGSDDWFNNDFIAFLTGGLTNSFTATHTEGIRTVSNGYAAHAEGNGTIANGNYSHAEGQGTITYGVSSHAEGFYTTASGYSSHAEGYETTAFGESSHVEGQSNVAFGDKSHAEGVNTIASGNSSHAEGNQTRAFGNYSHAEGQGTTASGVNSHSEGLGSKALGIRTHTEGNYTTAIGINSHAEGNYTTASGQTSHAEGFYTITIGDLSHTEGIETTAIGESSHAGGSGSTAEGIISFVHSTNSLVTGERSAILGGQNITGTTDDTVYVPNLHVINESTFDQKVTFSNGVLLADSSNLSTIDISSGAYNQYNFGTGLNQTIIYQDNSGIEFAATYNGFSSNTLGTAGISIARNGGGSWSDAILLQGNYDNDITNSGGPYYTGIIINSAQSTIKSGLTGTVILGGQDITGTTSDTIYVSNLNINTTPSNDNSLTQVLVRDTDGTIKYRSSSSLSGASSSINEGRILYVSTVGNDSNATIGDLSKPYLTLEAARTASSSGDSIYVFAGSYTATTTSTNGLAKDGISYYFEPNTTITKSSSGDLFNMSAFTIGFNVYGKANFIKNTNSGYILYAGAESSPVALDFVFECNNITQSVGNTFSVSDGAMANFCKISVNNVINSSGDIFSLSRYGNIDITGNRFRATSGRFLNITNGNYYINIRANKIECTAGIAFAGLYNSTINCDVTVTSGVGSAYQVTYGATLILKGYTNLISVGGGSLYQNGVCEVLTVSAGVVKECNTYSATVSGGEVNIKPIENYPGSLTQSGGIVYINSAINSGYSLAASITGGRLFMNGIFTNNYTYGNISINGANAEVVFDGKLVHGGSDYIGGKSPFTLTNGKLRLRGNIENILTSSFDGSCVDWVGGYLICDGITLITSNSEVPPIICSSSAKNLRTYTGGLTTNRTENGGTLVAKKQKYKFTVVSVASTSLTLNDGSGGNETFTESNTGTYGTTAALAQRMASLINASGTLDLTASQDTPGTDAYFYVEADTAGSPYTLPSYTNLTPLGIRSNSYQITEVVGGTIIENSNVL